VNVSPIGIGASTAATGSPAQSIPAPKDFVGQISQLLANRKSPLTTDQTAQIVAGVSDHGDIGPALGFKPFGDLQLESTRIAQESSSKLFDMVNNLDSAVGPNGQALTGKERLDQFSEQVVGLANEIGDSTLELAAEADDLNRLVIGVTDLANKNPAMMSRLMGVMERIQARIEKVQVEIDKRAEMRAFLLQMAGGNPSKATIEKLRKMGLGSWVDDVVRQMLKAIRKTTGVPQGLIVALQAAGLGGLVETDAQSLAKDKVRGKERLELKGADRHRELVGQLPTDQAKSGAIAVGAPLSQGRTNSGAQPIGISGPTAGAGSPTQTVAHQ
jgi:hypothetical protein